jgi:peptidoglycan/LPS O-acetylase OafA/YrhL
VSVEARGYLTAGVYRPDIDGLRAVAITAVVAYHAFPALAPGGFVGVDIFFVISGFLITGMIAGARDDGRFRFAEFYQRRARRILPAYFVVVAATTALALWLLLPKDLHAFCGALIASCLFLTNAWFASAFYYFSPAGRDAPLLHLWSLAVEEQFYLVWPLLIAGLSMRRLRPWRPALMLALAIASLAGAQVLIGQGAAKDAFYFLPSRAWEFLLGGVLAVRGVRPPASPMAANTGALIGLGFLAVSLAVLNDDAPFPGFGALAPCLGTALLIWSGLGEAPAATAVLRVAPVVGLGRISYALYLWHWPLLVLPRLVLQQPLSPLANASLVLLALCLSVLTWMFVEQPWRSRQGRRRHFGLGLGVSAALILVAIGAGFVGAGLPGRMPPGTVLDEADVNPAAGCLLFGKQRVPPGRCTDGPAQAAGSVLVWGDSHADALAPGVLAWAEAHDLRVRQVSRGGCPPLVGARVLTDGHDSDPECARFNKGVLQTILIDPSVRFVVLSARWPLYMDARPPMGGFDPPMTLEDQAGRGYSLGAALDHTLGAIEAGGGKARVVVIGPVPELPFSVPSCMGQARRFDLDMAHCRTAPAMGSLARADPAIQQIEAAVSRHPAVRAVFPSRQLCSAQACRTVQDGVLLYYDADHLSATGARKLVRAWLDTAAGPTPPAAPPRVRRNR